MTSFPHLIQKRRSQLGFVTYLLTYLSISMNELSSGASIAELLYWLSSGCSVRVSVLCACKRFSPPRSDRPWGPLSVLYIRYRGRSAALTTHPHLRLMLTLNMSKALILYEPYIILQYVYKPTRCTKFLWLDIVFQYTLYMFRTVSVHLQEQSFYKLYVVFGIGGYVWLLCDYSNTTARRIAIYRYIPNAMYSL